MFLEFKLELPTSLNKLYINQTRFDKRTRSYIPTGKRILSEEGRACKMRLQKYAKMQLKQQKKNWNYDYTIDNHIYMDAVVYFPRMGMDENNIWKLLCDSLEKIVYENDSRVLTRTQRVLYDKDNPRVELTLMPVDYIGIFDNEKELIAFEGKCESCSRYLNGRCKIFNQAKEGRIQDEISEDQICSEYKERKN